MATAYGCRRRTRPQEHPQLVPGTVDKSRRVTHRLRHLSPSTAAGRHSASSQLFIATDCAAAPAPACGPRHCGMAGAPPAQSRYPSSEARDGGVAADWAQARGCAPAALPWAAASTPPPHHQGPGLWCWIECCRIGADFPRPARLAPRWGQHLEARQELGLARVGLHLPGPAAWPLYRCCHASAAAAVARQASGCGLGFCRHPFAVRRPQHDGAIHQFGLEVVAGLEVEPVTKAGRQGQPAVIMQFEGRQEIYPEGAKARSSSYRRGPGLDQIDGLPLCSACRLDVGLASTGSETRALGQARSIRSSPHRR